MKTEAWVSYEDTFDDMEITGKDIEGASTLLTASSNYTPGRFNANLEGEYIIERRPGEMRLSGDYIDNYQTQVGSVKHTKTGPYGLTVFNPGGSAHVPDATSQIFKLRENALARTSTATSATGSSNTGAVQTATAPSPLPIQKGVTFPKVNTFDLDDWDEKKLETPSKPGAATALSKGRKIEDVNGSGSSAGKSTEASPSDRNTVSSVGSASPVIRSVFAPDSRERASLLSDTKKDSNSNSPKPRSPISNKKQLKVEEDTSPQPPSPVWAAAWGDGGRIPQDDLRSNKSNKSFESANSWAEEMKKNKVVSPVQPQSTSFGSQKLQTIFGQKEEEKDEIEKKVKSGDMEEIELI